MGATSMKLIACVISLAAVLSLVGPAGAQPHLGLKTRLNTCDLYSRQPASYPQCYFGALPICLDSRPCSYNGTRASVCLRWTCYSPPQTGPGGIFSPLR